MSKYNITYHQPPWANFTWDKITSMIDECYVTQDNSDDVICVGSYFHTPGHELKEILQTKYNKKFNKIIVYQSEPLVDAAAQDKTRLLTNIRTADEIWEYDLENAIMLKDLGYQNVKYKPPLICDSLRGKETVQNPDIDILFYGSHSTYRSNFINDLYSKSVIADELMDIMLASNVCWAYNFSHELLEEMISRSKIILNLNPHDGNFRQQTTRISHALSNNKRVLTQTHDINYFNESVTTFNGIQSCCNNLLMLLENDNWRKPPNNWNKNFLNPKNRTNTAVFLDLSNNGDYNKRYVDTISNMQQNNVYDFVDYIHVNWETKLADMHFHRLNRQTVGHDMKKAISDFMYFMPEYKVFKITDDDIEVCK